VSRLRLRFTKLGKVRFTSHRDVARLWERAFRRAELPVAYSEGFSPRPRLHFGLALSTGHESVAEYLDVDLVGDEVDLAVLPPRLSAVLPEGIDCVAAAPIPRATPSLQESVTSCTWQIDAVAAQPTAVQEAVDRLLAAEEVLVERERKGRAVVDDVRPAVWSLRLDPEVVESAVGEWAPAGAVVVRLHAELGTQPRGVRPAELLGALGSELVERRAFRLAQWMSPDGAVREEPLPFDATGRSHAGARAS
jgi:radical SAM-linked protein